MAATKYLDYNGLLYFWTLIKNMFAKPSDANPQMDGSASAGSSALYARGDHRHPSDTSKANDSAVVHLAGPETITGLKTFTGAITLTQDIDSPHIIRLDSNNNSYAGIWDSAFSKWLLYSNDSGVAYFKGTADAASSVPWSGVTDKPSTFAPSAHDHGYITNDGKISIGSDNTASKVVVTNASSAVVVSSVTAAELGCLSGVTSNVQTQLGTKAVDSAVVHLAGSETVTGNKTFTGNVIFTSSDASPHNISLGANESGSSGIWDSKYSRWMLYSNSGGEAFFKGTADAAPWSGITGKPTTVGGYGITDAYTKTEVDQKLTGGMHYKGSVQTVADLPASGNQVGDFYNIIATGENYAWDGTAWDQTGSIVDLQPITNAEIDTIVAS